MSDWYIEDAKEQFDAVREGAQKYRAALLRIWQATRDMDSEHCDTDDLINLNEKARTEVQALFSSEELSRE